jgi:cell division protein FtsN
VLPELTKPDNANDGDKSGNITSYAGNYAIQVGAFNVLENAVKVRAHLILALGTNVYILEQGGMYKVIITGFDEYAKAKAYLPEIRNREYKDAFIIGLKEASGMVYFADTNKQNGLGEILVALYNEAGALVDRTRSNAEGYFSFKGLPTGSYVAKVDPGQLKLINMVASPETLSFEFERNLFTVAKTNLEFTLRTLVPDKPAQEPAKAASQIEKITPAKTRNDEGIVKAVPTIGLPPQQDNGEKITGVKKSNPLPGTYAIQAGAYVDIENARKIRSRLIDGLNHDVFITEEDGMFKVVVIGFDDYAKAETFLPVIRNRGFTEAFIVRIK